MSDQKDEQTRRAREDAPDSRLAGRLLARATRPLGVIDVRHTERQYARVMDWLAGRTSLVEHLRARYGLTEDDRARTLGLALAGAHGAERIDEPGGLSAAPAVTGAPAAERFFTSVAHVPEDAPAAPAETRRVRRRGVPTFSPLSPGPRSDAGARQESGGDDVLEQTISSPDQTPSLQAPFSVKEVPDAPARGTAQTTRPLPPPTSSHDESDAATRGRPATTVGGEATSSGKRTGQPRARAAELSPGTGETVSTRASAAEGVREAWHADALRVAEAPGAKPPPQAQRRVAEPVGAQGAGVMPRAGEPIPERPGPAEGAQPRATKASAQAAKAQAVKPEAAPTFVAKELGATNVSGEAHLPLAHARETPAGGFERDGGASRARPALPLAAGPNNVERAPATPTPHAPAAGVETPGAGRGRGKAAEVNVEKLTEQVSRHLARRLLVERERRGYGRK